MLRPDFHEVRDVACCLAVNGVSRPVGRVLAWVPAILSGDNRGCVNHPRDSGRRDIKYSTGPLGPAITGTRCIFPGDTRPSRTT